MKLYFVILLALFGFNIQAQTYEGYIRKYPIFLEVDTSYADHEVWASYFYQSQLQNIFLNGVYNGDELVIHSRYSELEDKEELFTLTFDGDSLNGVWQNEGKFYDVKLSKTNQNTDEFKVQKSEFVRDSVTSYGEMQLVWLHEKYSETSLFRLGNGFTREQRMFLNPKLDAIHLDYALTSLSCGWAEYGIEPELISVKYISFGEYFSIECGGAHPNYGLSGYNFDIEEKKELNSLSDVYPDVDVYQLLKEKYEGSDSLQSECEYFTPYNEISWKYSTWILTENGVFITPSYPHALTPCEESFLLTDEELNSVGH